LKLQRTRNYGADVLLSTPEEGQNRETAAAAMAIQFSTDHGATLLHPFDDWDVIYGQGSLALEIFEQTNCPLDALVVPCGGGGMMAGVSLAKQSVSPHTDLYAVEPVGYDDHFQSFNHPQKARTPLQSGVGSQPASVCDALQASAPGVFTWHVNKDSLTGACVISDSEAIAAMKIAFTELKLVLEPSGAIALAALMSGQVTGLRDGSCVGVVACGGNIAIDDYIKLLGN
jgi:threonine dehydratase